MGDRTGSHNFDTRMYLYDPNGVRIAYDGADEYTSHIRMQLTNSGTYTVVCRENDVHTGSYALSLLFLDDGHALVTDTDVGDITSGQTINGTINQSGDLDAAFFTAGAGDTVTLTMGDRTGSHNYDLRVYLYDPDGSLIESASGESSATISTTITNAGQHTVVMRENDVHTGGYNISLTLVPADPPETLDLTVYTPQSYGGSQDADSSQYEVLDSGATLRMWGNNWKVVNYPYTVTPETVIEFDFRSTGSQGEINGICFDTDLSISDNRTFEVFGSQTWGLQNYHDYSGTEWTHYTIPVGQFYTGTFSWVGFVNDADGGQATDVYYRNIHIYESE
jgi:catechol 2,3-dioxygenase-like lactoylglutathione lyase family enzyme